MQIIIEGKPEPQLRPRARRQGNSIRLYDPKKTRDYKKLVSWQARSQWKEKPLEGELQVVMDIYRQIPKSVSNKRRTLKNNREIRPIVRPDVDNYTKGVLDSLNGICYKDDSQIVSLIANKYYSDNPRVEISIKKIS